MTSTGHSQSDISRTEEATVARLSPVRIKRAHKLAYRVKIIGEPVD